MKLGEFVKQRRRQAGLTQIAFGEKAGIDHSRIHLIERGFVSNPTLKTIRRIADALGLRAFICFVDSEGETHERIEL